MSKFFEKPKNKNTGLQPKYCIVVLMSEEKKNTGWHPYLVYKKKNKKTPGCAHLAQLFT